LKVSNNASQTTIAIATCFVVDDVEAGISYLVSPPPPPGQVYL